MSCISGNAVFPAFSSAAFSTSRQTSNQLMPRHEANELLRPRLLKEQDVPLWYRAFHVTGCVPEWSRPYLPTPGEFAIVCCLLYTQSTLLGKGRGVSVAV